MGQPVMDTTLKDMLISLRRFLQVDMLSLMHNFGHRINVEVNIGDIITTLMILLTLNR